MVAAANGRQGLATVNALASHQNSQFEVRAIVRNPEKATSLHNRPDVTVVQGDLNDIQSLKSACQGVFGFYFYCPNALSIGMKAYYKYLQNLTTVAKESGVSSFV